MRVSIHRHVFEILAICVLAALTAPIAGAVQVETLSYGPDGAQVLDLHTPDVLPSELMPVAVLAHGGLWQTGARSALSTLCTNIVERSGGTMACATIDYRLSQNLGGVCTGTGTDVYEEQVRDMATAFALLQSEATARGLDPARMHVGGHSAGGHLAQTFNLRWDEFAQPCSNPAGCPAALGAMGFEGIYDIPAWDAYDAVVFGGAFACATRKAFGAPGPSPAACQDPEFGERCWDAGSPIYLAQNAIALDVAPAGDALLIHSPGDTWVDIAEATNLGAALELAFPEIAVEVNVDGTCATGQHNDPLIQTGLADCLIDFIAARQPPAPVPAVPSASGAGLVGFAMVLGIGGLRRLRSRASAG